MALCTRINASNYGWLCKPLSCACTTRKDECCEITHFSSTYINSNIITRKKDLWAIKCGLLQSLNSLIGPRHIIQYRLEYSCIILSNTPQEFSCRITIMIAKCSSISIGICICMCVCVCVCVCVCWRGGRIRENV